MHQSVSSDGSGGRRVVVTGMGAVSPLGLDLPSTWKALLSGACGIRRITRFDPTGFPVTFAAEVDCPQARGDLKISLIQRATREALAASGLPGGPRVGVCLGSESARPDIRLLAWRFRTGDLPRPQEIVDSAPWAPTREVARMVGAEGIQSTIATACSSSGQAIGEAVLRIRRGQQDAIIAGGVDVLVDPIMVAGFALLGALSTRNDDPERASRPFDLGRDGFVLGEGAATLVLESLDHAQARGATILGEMLGYGTSLNAYRITDSPPDGRGAAQAMQAAMTEAGLEPEDVDYINAHGTSTMQNDLSESAAIRSLFGERNPQVMVSSTKGATGHLVAACGALEAVFCLLAIQDSLVPHTVNLVDLDPACAGPDHVMDRPRSTRVRSALSNSFGFGGSNAVLAMGPPP